MERALLGGLGVVVGLFGALFFIFFISELATGGDGKTTPGVYVGLIVFFGGVMVAGGYLAWRMLFSRPGFARASGATRPGTGQTHPTQATTAQQGTGSDDAPPANAAERERRILRLAEREHGRVTIPEVATQCIMTVEESKLELDRLVLQHAAEIQVTTSGVLVYVFPGFLSDQDKAGATDL